MKPKTFDPLRDLSWYRDQTKAHASRPEKEQRDKWQLILKEIRAKKHSKTSPA